MKKFLQVFLMLTLLLTFSDGSIVKANENNIPVETEINDYIYISTDLPEENGYPSINLKALYGYSAKNIKTAGSYYGDIIRKNLIDPGVNDDFCISFSKETTVSGSVGIGAQDINMSLGISNTSNIEISDTFGVECPEGYSYCEFKVFPIIQRVTFDEYYFNSKLATCQAQYLLGFRTIFNKY